jgi:predicted ATPase
MRRLVMRFVLVPFVCAALILNRCILPNLHLGRVDFITQLLGKEDLEMPNSSQPDFSTTELDANLLATPFKVQTNWHVIAGTASSGKTTLINQLAEKGFQTVPETARLYIKREMAKGQTLHPIRTDAAALQRNIKNMQLSIESELRANDMIFLDAAVPSSLAYYRVFGLNPNEILLECFHHRYASVFILEPLPFQLDEERVEEIAAFTSFLDRWHTRDYLALGYNVVRVPILSPEERLAFVLERLSEQGWM